MATEFPQEVVDEIIDRLAGDKTTRVASLQGCSLVSSQWLYRSQKHLFRKVRFTDATFSQWCREIRPGDGGPSPHVTVLHYRSDYGQALAIRLAERHRHFSSFTNLQKLHLREIPIRDFTDEELSMCFKQMGCSVRSVSLRACKMTINDLVSFVRHFVKLERLSIIDPIVYSNNTTFDDSMELPILGGVLELRYLFADRRVRDFIHQLSLLPLAFHTVILEGIHISLSPPINELLATCRETLARIDIRDHFVRNINLTDCDVLREMHFNAEIIDHLPPIIRTVTSPQLEEIRFILWDPLYEKHYDYLDEWELVDTEICTLIDRIRPAGREGWNLSLRLVTTPTTDTCEVRKPAAQLFPASSQHKNITLSTDCTGLT